MVGVVAGALEPAQADHPPLLQQLADLVGVVLVPCPAGVGIEDIALITDTGCEVLTHSPKELIVL